MTTQFIIVLLAGVGLARAGGAEAPFSAPLMSSAGATAIQRDAEPEGCARYQMQFDEQEVARAEESVDVPRASVERLTAKTGRGGVLVLGWSGADYRVKACKAAGGDTMSEAQARVGAMSLSVNGGQVSVSEPSGDGWAVHLIVYAPKGGAVSLEASNGPLSVRSFSGTAEMVSRNGPISIDGSTGHITARAVNGPVSVTRSSGDISARTENGPVSVSLEDRQWQGARLEASTQNGPVNLRVPDGYQSGVEVRMGRNSPFRCASAACRDTASRTWDDDGRRVVMGGDTPLVKLSTVNGPVTIGDRRD